MPSNLQLGGLSNGLFQLAKGKHQSPVSVEFCMWVCGGGGKCMCVFVCVFIIYLCDHTYLMAYFKHGVRMNW